MLAETSGPARRSGAAFGCLARISVETSGPDRRLRRPQALPRPGCRCDSGAGGTTRRSRRRRDASEGTGLGSRPPRHQHRPELMRISGRSTDDSDADRGGRGSVGGHIGFRSRPGNVLVNNAGPAADSTPRPAGGAGPSHPLPRPTNSARPLSTPCAPAPSSTAQRGGGVPPRPPAPVRPGRAPGTCLRRRGGLHQATPGQESGSSTVDAARRRGRQSWADSSPAAPTRAHSAHGPIAYTAPPMSGPAPVPIVYATPYNPW